MGWVRGEGGMWGVKREKKSIQAVEDGKERHLSVNTRGGKKKGKPVGIADFTVLPLLKGNNAWLSNQSQVLCRKSSHMRGAMTPSSLQSHGFLHAFLFWGVFMNDLKSDPFLSAGCLEGSRLGEGGVWGGEADPDAKVSRLRRDQKPNSRSPRHASNMDRMNVSVMRSGAKPFVFMKRDRFWPRVKDTWRVRWQLCKLENNIYRASHLTSFITKSHTPGSPMKLGVNPSSASLFFFLSHSPWSRLIPHILSPSLSKGH